MVNMKYFIFVVLVVAISANADVEELWRKFKEDHNKRYSSSAEESLRFKIFQENLKNIQEHNQKYLKGESTYYKGVNKFTDLTVEEFSQKYLTQLSHPPRNEVNVLVSDNVPESKNWTDEGVVTSVKDQKTCGACYLFAAVGAIESGNAIVNKKLLNLSVQQVLDCSAGDVYLNHGCNGGIIEGSIHYVIDHGIQSEDTYPYEYRQEKCRAKKELNVVSVANYSNVPEDQNLLKTVVGTIGPVAACADASAWFDYAGGIINGECYDKRTNHVILITGYGTENGTDYWYIKNSWGPSWGMNGYLKVKRNGDNDFCISTYTAYPIMK